MRLSQVEKRARSMGIKDTWKLSKSDLIKTIQRKEGFSDCFATPTNLTCNQNECCWRDECLK